MRTPVLNGLRLEYSKNKKKQLNVISWNHTLLKEAAILEAQLKNYSLIFSQN